MDHSSVEFKNTLILVNPRAGKGRGSQAWARLLRAHPALAQSQRIDCQDLNKARQEITDALFNNIQRLIVIGGDGSLHLAANQILKHQQVERIALGLIPAGTGSDYARLLRLPGDPIRAFQQICSAEPRKVDVLRITKNADDVRYAINTFSAGVSGWVSRHLAGPEIKKPGAYLRTTLKAFIDFEAVNCRVIVDDSPWFEGPLYLLAITKGSHFGQGMHISPRARLDNGLCEVVVVEPMSRWLLPLRLCRLYLGNHLSASYVHYCRGQTVSIEPLCDNHGFEIDGESTESAPVTVETLPRALTILA